MSRIALNQSGSDSGNLAGTDGSAHVLEQGTRPGEMATRNVRNVVNGPYRYVPIGADGVVLAAPGLLAGIICTSNGIIQLYDNASAASGQSLTGTYAMTAGGTWVPPNGPIELTLGCYARWTSGAFLVMVKD